MFSMMPTRHLPDLRTNESLETFIDRHLRPPKEFMLEMLQSVDKVVRYLHKLSSKNSYKHYSIKEIVKSGSLGKGTSYRQTADVDLVVFFNGYKDMNSFLKDKPQILQDIKWYMCNTEPESWRWFGYFRSSYRPEWVEQIRVVRVTDYHVEFEAQINYSGKIVTVNLDILPTIDIIDMHCSMFSDGVNSVYTEMKRQYQDVQGHYSVCFCKRQKLLYDGGMAKVKDLIRLVKYWRTSNGLELKSYGCEVLALWVYKNRLNENKSFKMITGFKEVLEILVNIYGEEVIPSDSGIRSEYLECFNDPANPYSSTIPYRGRQEIRNCADSTLRSMDNVTEETEGLCAVQ